MKSLYEKANELWQTLSAVTKMAEANIAGPVDQMQRVLAENRPELIEQPDIEELRSKLRTALDTLQKVYVDSQELPHINKMVKVAIWDITRPTPAAHCQHSDDVQDEPPFETPIS